MIQMRQKMDRAAQKVGMFVEGQAKLNAPVDTGDLRNSISHEVESTETNSKVYVGSNKEYAATVEFGFSPKGIPAQPYLRPSVENNLDQIEALIIRELKL